MKEVIDWNKVYKEATNAGIEAAKRTVPTPMVVQRHQNMLDDNSPVVQSEVIEGGVCGFAWVIITPARGSFVKWCKDNNVGALAYGGGWRIGIHYGGQSLELKLAYAHAFAIVLTKYGINAYANSRLD